MTTTTRILFCTLVFVNVFCKTSNGLALEEKVQQLEQHFIEATTSLEAKVAQLESKVTLLETKVGQQSLIVAEQENQTFSEDDGEKGDNGGIQDEISHQHRTCFELKTADPSLTSGMHWIDPDGEDSGDPPIYVHCDMETGTSSILHDSESTINVTKCRPAGCYSRQIKYEASGKQIAALAELSSECHQSITYDCTSAQLNFNGVHYGWWNDTNGEARYFWAGNKTDVHTCQCGIDRICHQGKSFVCNCDSIESHDKLKDIGIITDKEILPVTRLNFGKNNLRRSFGAHTLGRFKCSGQSTVNKGTVLPNPMPTSCEELKKIGHNLNGIDCTSKEKKEPKGLLEAKVAQLESKLTLLEAKVEQQALIVAEQENQTFDGDIQDGISQQHRTCFELKTADPSLTSGMHWIDPDGEDSGDPPIYVHCDMETGTSSILHDSESMINVTKCPEPGCYSRRINYNASEKQIAALAELSSECHQSIRYDCTVAYLRYNRVDYSWWNDRQGEPRYFWAGNKTDVHICQCGIDGYCHEGEGFVCNCDSIDSNVNLNDSGIITDKEILPVTQLNFGKSNFKRSSGAHTLGRFECSGQSTVSKETVLANPMPTSCEELKKIGHTLNGIYSVIKKERVKTVYCGFTTPYTETELNSAQTGVSASYLRGKLNKISNRFAENAERLNETKATGKQLTANLTYIAIDLAETKDFVDELEKKLSEDISRLRQEALEYTRKADDILKGVNGTLNSLFATKIQTKENVTLTRISELTTQLNELQSTVENKFENTETELNKTKTELSNTEGSVKLLTIQFYVISKQFAENAERLNESLATSKELSTKLTETTKDLMGTKDFVKELDNKLTEDISQLRQESTETLEYKRKTDDILKDVNVTLYTLFVTKEELLIKATLQNIQTTENDVTLTRISELTTQLNELQSSVVNKFENTETELNKTRTELSNTDVSVRVLTNEVLLITATLQNIQTPENVAIPMISELTNQLNELQSTLENQFERTKIELNKTRIELGNTETNVKDLTAKLDERTNDIVDIRTIPSSCSDLQKMGHKMSGVYLVAESKTVKTVYCNFIPLNGIRFETFIGYADVKSSPTYFYVQRMADYFDQTNIPIPFDVEQLNVGKAMNLKSGKFTTPVTGKYFFSASGTVYLEKSTKWNKADIFLYKNGIKVGTARSDSNNNDYQYETFVIQSTFHLLKGDEIWLELFFISPGAKLYGRHSTHFSGFLLEEEMSL